MSSLHHHKRLSSVDRAKSAVPIWVEVGGTSPPEPSGPVSRFRGNSGGSSIRGRGESFSSIVPPPGILLSPVSPPSHGVVPPATGSSALPPSAPIAPPGTRQMSFDYKPRQMSTDALFANINHAVGIERERKISLYGTNIGGGAPNRTEDKISTPPLGDFSYLYDSPTKAKGEKRTPPNFFNSNSLNWLEESAPHTPAFPVSDASDYSPSAFQLDGGEYFPPGLMNEDRIAESPRMNKALSNNLMKRDVEGSGRSGFPSGGKVSKVAPSPVVKKSEPFLATENKRPVSTGSEAKKVTTTEEKLAKIWDERKLVANEAASSAVGDFTVMSWNVLASYIADAGGWEARRDLIMAEIMWRKPDLLFIQELQLRDSNNVCDKHTNHAAWFRTTLLDQGYDGYYNKKVRGSSTVLIAWKKAKFSSQGVWSDFNNLQQNVKDGGSPLLLNQIEKLSKKRVLFVILKHHTSRKRIITCSLHASAPIIDGKLANHLPLIDTAGALSELDLAAHYMSSGGIPLPVIMGSDLNAQMDAIARKFVTSGRVAPYDSVFLSASKFGCELPPIGHNLNVASVYETCLGKEAPYTKLDSRVNFKGAIDYMFYSKDTVEVVKVLDVYPLAEAFGIPSIPNEFIPSDHISLFAEVRFLR